MDNYILLLIIVVIVIATVYNRYESFLPVWDLQRCKLACQRMGTTMPWSGGISPHLNRDGSTFDVAGCMENCERSTW